MSESISCDVDNVLGSTIHALRQTGGIDALAAGCLRSALTGQNTSSIDLRSDYQRQSETPGESVDLQARRNAENQTAVEPSTLAVANENPADGEAGTVGRGTGDTVAMDVANRQQSLRVEAAQQMPQIRPSPVSGQESAADNPSQGGQNILNITNYYGTSPIDKAHTLHQRGGQVGQMLY